MESASLLDTLCTPERQSLCESHRQRRWLTYWSYAEGLIDKGEFEPRVTRLRQRLARLEEQRQVLADEAALQGELQLIIGHLEDFAAKLRDGLEAADWASKRDLIRILVKRVEVARDDVNVVFRIDPYPSDTDPGKKSLQLCRGSNNSPLRGAGQGCTKIAPVHHSCTQEFPEKVSDIPVRHSFLHRLD